ncbi:MAG TPA: hypothetical protein DCL80_09925, partial [Balneola sp.]|nr:hypothetical protein [Balneola sp.]
MATEDQPDDPGRRRFVKQVAGAAAGAIVDPTILAEPATKAAATVAKGIIPQAISTAYRFAVSVPVQTAEGETIEGESIVDVDYDSESNTLSVQDLDQDGNIITEEKFEVPIKDPTMKDIDDFAASVIKTGINPLDPKGSQIFDPKAVYSVQSPIRDPHYEEGAAGEFGEGMTVEELKDYDASDLDFLENVGEGVNSTDPVHPTGSQVDHSIRSYEEPPRVTLDGEPIGPTGKLMKRQPYDSLVAHPEDHMARKAGLARRYTTHPNEKKKPATEPAQTTAPAATKVIDQIGKLVTENTEALKVLKEAIGAERDLAKPVEGEVIPAKRKREPGMAEEETMQDLRDALAGSEERLERLQDVGRDEDVETIEEYEAEIEAYKKDIKDLKEEMKEVGATLPRRVGEGPVLRQALTREAETIEQEYEEAITDENGEKITDNFEIPYLDKNGKPSGEIITLGKLAEKLSKPRGKRSDWQAVSLRTPEFWKAFLKLIYNENNFDKFDRFEIDNLFNEWNKNTGKIFDR